MVKKGMLCIIISTNFPFLLVIILAMLVSLHICHKWVDLLQLSFSKMRNDLLLMGIWEIFRKRSSTAAISQLRNGEASADLFMH